MFYFIEFSQELLELQEKYKSQTKEVRDAMAQRKLAMDEFTDINEHLADLRSQKQKLSRQLRDKDEELEEQRQKMEGSRQDLRKVEKGKREVGWRNNCDSASTSERESGNSLCQVLL